MPGLTPEQAEEHLNRQIGNYYMEIENGSPRLTANELAIATLLLHIRERLEAMNEKQTRLLDLLNELSSTTAAERKEKHANLLEQFIVAITTNKKLAGYAISMLVIFLLQQLSQIFEIRELFGATGDKAIYMSLTVLIMFVFSLFMFVKTILHHSSKE